VGGGVEVKERRSGKERLEVKDRRKKKKDVCFVFSYDDTASFVLFVTRRKKKTSRRAGGYLSECEIRLA
jgi:hypothetical protein